MIINLLSALFLLFPWYRAGVKNYVILKRRNLAGLFDSRVEAPKKNVNLFFFVILLYLEKQVEAR